MQYAPTYVAKGKVVEIPADGKGQIYFRSALFKWPPRIRWSYRHTYMHTHTSHRHQKSTWFSRGWLIPRTIIIILRRMVVVPWVKETIKDGGASQATPTRILLRALRNFHTRVNNVHWTSTYLCSIFFDILGCEQIHIAGDMCLAGQRHWGAFSTKSIHTSKHDPVEKCWGYWNPHKTW